MNDYEYQKNSRFLDDWEVKRQNKRKIYRNHFFIWGLFASNLVYLFTIKFNLNNFEWLEYVLRIVFWGLGSQFYAWLTIRTGEKLYKKLLLTDEFKDRNPELEAE